VYGFILENAFVFPFFGAATNAIGNDQKALRKPRSVFELSFVAGTSKKKYFLKKKLLEKKKHLWYIWVFLENRGTVPPKKNHLLKNRGFFL